MCLYIFISHDLHQSLTHVVGFPPATIIHLDILEKAEEESVDSNGVDREACVGNVVRTKENTEDGDQVVVKINVVIIESDGEASGGDANDKDLAKNHDKVSDLIHKESSDNVGSYQVKCILNENILKSYFIHLRIT